MSGVSEMPLAPHVLAMLVLPSWPETLLRLALALFFSWLVGDLTATPAGGDAAVDGSSVEEHGLLEGERWAFVKACGTLLGLALSATQNLRLDVSLSDALAPLDRQEVAQGAVTLAHQLGW